MNQIKVSVSTITYNHAPFIRCMLESVLNQQTNFTPEGTIVGWGAVVTKSIDTSFCAIAGNPAKIVKRNLVWTTGPDTKYQQNDWGDAK